MLNREQVMASLRNVEDVPQIGKLPKHRTIYETASGNFSIDYASFPGGTSEDVPLAVIHELVSQGVIVSKHPQNPKIKMWILAELIDSL